MSRTRIAKRWRLRNRQQEIARATEAKRNLNAQSKKTATRHRRLWTAEEVAFLHDNPDLTDQETAQRLNRTRFSIANARKRRGLSHDHLTCKRLPGPEHELQPEDLDGSLCRLRWSKEQELEVLDCHAKKQRTAFAEKHGRTLLAVDQRYYRLWRLRRWLKNTSAV